MSATAVQEEGQQGLFERQCEALQGRQERATLRAQHQALQDLLAAVGVATTLAKKLRLRL
jgi:hypothetical protein